MMKRFHPACKFRYKCKLTLASKLQTTAIQQALRVSNECQISAHTTTAWQIVFKQYCKRSSFRNFHFFIFQNLENFLKWMIQTCHSRIEPRQSKLIVKNYWNNAKTRSKWWVSQKFVAQLNISRNFGIFFLPLEGDRQRWNSANNGIHGGQYCCTKWYRIWNGFIRPLAGNDGKLWINLHSTECQNCFVFYDDGSFFALKLVEACWQWCDTIGRTFHRCDKTHVWLVLKTGGRLEIR